MDGGTSGSNQINMQELTAFINSNKKKSKSKKKTVGLGKKTATVDDNQYADAMHGQMAGGAGRPKVASMKTSSGKSKLAKTISDQTQGAGTPAAYQMPRPGTENTKTSGGGTAKFGESMEVGHERGRSRQGADKYVTDTANHRVGDTFEGKARALLDKDLETHSEPGNGED